MKLFFFTSRKFRRFTYATTADTDLGSGGFSRRLVGAAALAAAVIGASFAAQSGAVLPETEEERERRERRRREEEAADRPWRLNMGFKVSSDWAIPTSHESVKCYRKYFKTSIAGQIMLRIKMS